MASPAEVSFSLYVLVGRESYDEPAAHTRCAFGRDGAAVSFHNPPGDSEPHTRSALRAPTVQALEGIKDTIRVLLLEANAVVFHH